MNVTLCCPKCKKALVVNQERLLCGNCHSTYHFIDGIVSFIDKNEFYEEKYTKTLEINRHFGHTGISLLYKLLVLFDLTKRRTRFLSKSLNKLGPSQNLKILDLGCGGGNDFLGSKGDVAGVDLSLTALRNAKRVYSQVVHADVCELPFENEEFSIVTCGDLLGHIPFDKKEKAYSEMYRVLKRSGFMIHIAIECDGKNPWWRFAKKYPDLYKKYHIDQAGHVGMESASTVLKRFYSFGMKLIKMEKMYSLIYYCGALWNPMSFNNEYKEKEKFLKYVIFLDGLLSRNKIVRTAVNCILGVCSDIIEPILPLCWAQGISVILKK